MIREFLSHFFFEETFMQYALYAVLIASPMFALIGTMVVQNKMSFFSDALGHGAFTGIAVGSVLGLMQTAFDDALVYALLFSVLFSVVVTLVKHRTHMAHDTVIGVFSSLGIALGLFLVTLFRLNYSHINSFLIGDILSVTLKDIRLMLVILVMFLLLWALLANKVLLTGMNETLARSRKIPTLLVESLFACMVAVIVTVSIPWVGILVINSYLVLPAAASRNMARNMRQYTLYAVIISLLCSLAGLWTAYLLGTAAGATIVLLNALCFFLSLIVKSIRKS